MVADKRTALDLGVHICFADETGQGLRPPKGRTWAPRGQCPVVRVRGSGRGRVNVAGVVCFRPARRAHLLFRMLVYHGRRHEPKSFTWRGHRALITMAHVQLGTLIVWV
ncbi:transposase [Streptomyces sp. NPDC001714]|uniref:transposase n=1 Tax=Streptomyces sp. NPDC001714 TaxID=3364603 RepID=UPI0036CCBEE3